MYIKQNFCIDKLHRVNLQCLAKTSYYIKMAVHNLIICSVLLFIAVLETQASSFNCNGKPNGNYNHPRKCTKFIMCSNGLTYEMDCPANLHYNRDHGDYCDYPESTGCFETPEASTEKPLNECEATSTPQECISKPFCVYCLDTNSTARSKCDFRESSTCSKIYPPVDDEEEEDVSIDPEEGDSETIIGLEPSVPKNITVHLELSKALLDFYYLMDFSGSFSDDKRILVEKCPELISMLQTINSNPALGFGAFVDKPISPFGSPGDYSFRNRLSLTTNSTNYVDIIQSTPIQGGNDGPESILDGIFQAASCVNDIGWRQHSRRFLLATTDAQAHMAGDGKYRNLTTFNGECSLNADGHYTEELVYDYPSIEQIKQVIEENDIILTIAATRGLLPIYKEITDQIKGAESIELAYDSANIIEVIKKAYGDATEFVEIQASGLSDNLRVNYYSDCGTGGAEEETNICRLPENGMVSFTVEIELLNCPDPTVTVGPIVISPLGVTSHANVGVVAFC